MGGEDHLVLSDEILYFKDGYHLSASTPWTHRTSRRSCASKGAVSTQPTLWAEGDIGMQEASLLLIPETPQRAGSLLLLLVD